MLDAVARWAAGEPGIAAVALVGSHARGTAGPDSDLDLVLLAADPSAWLSATDWLSEFGQPEQIEREEYGVLASLRVHYANGLEVEFGITTPAWAALPADSGTAEVVRGGLRSLHDPRDLLGGLLRALPELP
jgi:hypothetical protein